MRYVFAIKIGKFLLAISKYCIFARAKERKVAVK